MTDPKFYGPHFIGSILTLTYILMVNIADPNVFGPHLRVAFYIDLYLKPCETKVVI